mmetsp:Transcript_36837/g.83368  ORF Transcript_36837/g.83368 Transcript_36837/m.83368 type:complete len:85 (-) Transcript_36837:38-292(-)
MVCNSGYTEAKMCMGTMIQLHKQDTRAHAILSTCIWVYTVHCTLQCVSCMRPCVDGFMRTHLPIHTDSYPANGCTIYNVTCIIQ